ncbi:MAG: TonB-dependent receptor [Terriglobia bacterium]|jgi:iron complex outermembrane receptor protein|nr:TonB-dependent receptor [Terriglobia bacterium]
MRLLVNCRQFTVLVLVLGSIIPCRAANATQNDQQTAKELKQLSLEQLSNIEITTTSKGPTNAFRAPAAVYVITAEDIRRAGVSTIPDALRLAPGVEVAQIDSNKWAIGIRGFGSRLSRSVLVLIDGRTVYTTLLAGTYWEVQDTLLSDIDRIEVIRGPGGTIWGPNAVNGVINIITKSASETHGTRVEVGGGNVQQGFANFRYGGATKGGFNYRVYGKWFTRGPMYHPDGRNFDDWRGGQGGFRTDWNNGEKNHFTVQGDLYKQEDGESVVATSYTAPFSRIIDANAHLSGGNILGRWTHGISDGNDIQVQAYYDRTNRHEPNFGDVRDTFDVDYVQHARITRNDFTFGFGARFSRGNDLQVVSGLTFSPAKRTDALITGFIQDEFAIVPQRLSLTIGTKLLHTNFTEFEPEPSARLLWTPNDKMTFWAAATQAVRTPSDAEHDFYLSGFLGLAPDGTPFFARFNANKDFRPEHMNGFELGYRQLISKKLFVDVASFYNHYSDLFSEDITGGPYLETTPQPTHYLLPAEFGNGLMGNTKGFEVSPEWRPTNFFRLRGSYSYLHMSIARSPNSIDIGTAPQIMGSSPQHQVTATSSFDLPSAFLLDLDFRFVSSLPAQKVPAYSTADARFSKQFDNGFRIALVGRNLLQPHHLEFGTDPGATANDITLVGIRRSAYIELSWVH